MLGSPVLCVPQKERGREGGVCLLVVYGYQDPEDDLGNSGLLTSYLLLQVDMFF